jgi:hypothetical protein
MKSTYKTIGLTAALTVSLFSCDENDGVRPADLTVANPAPYSANFLLINAVPDGTSLDLIINSSKIGASVGVAQGQAGYTSVPITSAGFFANTNVRARGTSAPIGGRLGANDAVYRAGNTSTNNLTAANGARFTFIALDSINRPAPLRTLSINPVTNALAADVTFYNRANGQQISLDQWKALPSDAARNNTVPLGALGVSGLPNTPIPTGITDPGGVRFLLITDTYPTFTSPNTTQSAIRFVNAVPNSYSLPTNTRISARLKPAAGATLTLGTTNTEYVMGTGGVTTTSVLGFSPSVGSRAVTATSSATTFGLPFPLVTTAIDAVTPIAYTLEFSLDGFTTPAIAFSLPNQTFAVGKIYTIVARGIVGKTGDSSLSAIIVQHN